MKEIKKIYGFSFFRSLVIYASISIAFYQANGLNYKSIMILQAIYSFFILIFEIPSGIFSDKIGRKKTLIISTVGFLFAYTCALFGKSFIPFLFMQFFAAIGESFYSGTFTAMVYEDLKNEEKIEHSKKVFANIQIINLFSALFASGISVVIVKYINMRFTYFVTAIMCFIALVISSTFIDLQEKTDDGKKQNSHRKMTFANYKNTFMESIQLLFSNAELKMLFLDYIIFAAIALSISYLKQPLLLATDLKPEYLGIVNIITILCSTFVLKNIHNIKKLLKEETYYKLSVLLSGLVLFCNVLFKSYFVVIFSFLLLSIFYKTRDVLMGVKINDYLNDSDRATSLSVISALKMFCCIILELILGVAADVNILLALIIALCFMIVAYAVLYFYRYKTFSREIK